MQDEPKVTDLALKDKDAGTVVPLNACEWTVLVSW